MLITKKKKIYSTSIDYIKAIIAIRHFWFHLALADIRTKYRRSYLGILWAILQPLFMTLLLSFVMGKIFKVSIPDYIPYILSGIIIWEFIVSSLVAGCSSFINSEPYIKQYTHPIVIYPLRVLAGNAITFSLILFVLMGLVAVAHPGRIIFMPEILFLSLPILIFFVYPLIIITAFIGVIFRGFQQLIVLLLQAMWYVSPIFFKPEIFYNAHTGFLLEYNPIYNVIHMFRAPLLDDTFVPLFR